MIRKYGFATLFCILTQALVSQAIELGIPELSPRGSVSQTSGLTTISIAFGSPSVRGREVWGKLVPFNTVWRMGANSATTIQFDRAVKIMGTEIPAGKYGIHAYIENSNNWLIGISRNSNDWADTTADIIRFPAIVTQSPYSERLRFLVSDFTDQVATISMQWADLAISFEVELETTQQILGNFQKLLEPNWESFAQASRYCIEVLGNYKLGGQYADQAYSLNSNWLTAYLKGLSRLKIGQKQESIRYLQESLNLGNVLGTDFFLRLDVENALKKAQN